MAGLPDVFVLDLCTGGPLVVVCLVFRTLQELSTFRVSIDTIPALAGKMGKKTSFWSLSSICVSKAAMLSLRQPRQQSGQEHISRIYNSIRHLRREDNAVTVMYAPAHDDDKWKKIAKEKAQMATSSKAGLPTQRPGMKSTMLNAARAKRSPTRSPLEKVGIHSKRVDTALPGKHTRQLYDWLSRREARALAQLRTGMAEQLSLPDQCCPYGSIRMRTSERDSGAFSLSMYQVEGVPYGDAPM
ncbi:uncharacterized protein PV06_11104 [Exophiala oligosperma]|uniref:Uncharacterized protein n=1 Tax=Exophiala oligosperma TaxID=215243 RepID=A0A0D2DLU0_9EURO|nr:uncharacterized protein PV06_11104 [Exophiala oligosperma]KIW36689.1 hypothetical protein PV06_11104 [Exophiala oligosperma]